MARTHYVSYVSGKSYTDKNHPEKTGAFSFSISTETGAMRRYSGYADGTTKDRMELNGILGIINAAPSGSKITVYGNGDVVKYISSGASRRWKNNGWKAANGKSIANIDLWSKLAPLCKERNVLPEFVVMDEKNEVHGFELREVSRRALKQQSDRAYILSAKK